MSQTFRTLIAAAGATTVLGACPPALALTDVVSTPDLQIGVGGRVQVMGFAEQLQTDVARSAGRIFLFQKQSRLEVGARRGDERFYAQLALGGEDVYTNNTNLTLLDMYAAGPLFGSAAWRVGQFRVPFGRELMANGGRMAFLDRSIAAPWLTLWRDVGAAVEVPVGPARAIAGVFTGGGRDVPQRYLPQLLGIPMLVARVGVGDVDADAHDLGQHDFLDTAVPRWGLAAGALFMRDSRVGHSTILNVKNKFDQSLLASGAWNPFLGKKDAAGQTLQGELFQAGVDAAMRWPTPAGVVAGEAEVGYGRFGNAAGALGVVTGRAQASLFRAPFEAAVRYAVVLPDPAVAATNATAGSPQLGQTTPILPDGRTIQELTPAVSWLIQGDRMKLYFDLPILLDAPVVQEKGVGAYNLVNQPDQTALLTNPANVLGRQLVFQLRGGLQYAF